MNFKFGKKKKKRKIIVRTEDEIYEKIKNLYSIRIIFAENKFLYN